MIENIHCYLVDNVIYSPILKMMICKCAEDDIDSPKKTIIISLMKSYHILLEIPEHLNFISKFIIIYHNLEIH